MLPSQMTDNRNSYKEFCDTEDELEFSLNYLIPTWLWIQHLFMAKTVLTEVVFLKCPRQHEISICGWRHQQVSQQRSLKQYVIKLNFVTRFLNYVSPSDGKVTAYNYKIYVHRSKNTRAVVIQIFNTVTLIFNTLCPALQKFCVPSDRNVSGRMASNVCTGCLLQPMVITRTTAPYSTFEGSNGAR